MKLIKIPTYFLLPENKNKEVKVLSDFIILDSYINAEGIQAIYPKILDELDCKGEHILITTVTQVDDAFDTPLKMKEILNLIKLSNETTNS